ncbi:MAG: DUF456 family protein [Puniceicoccales bacterium]|jgi:uncharacterized protein YqgC (DUF456 family)|nr:DUF456 family protein [Puniceicoccales bacterium]
MEIWFCVLAFVLLALGLAGVFVPGVPSPAISWGAYLVCFLAWKEGPVNGWWLLAASGLTVFSHAFEFVGGYLGAKWFKATWRGATGALIGSIAGPLSGFFLPLPGGALAGLVLGPFVGALAGELLGRRKWAEAAKVGLGTVAGNLASMLVKLLVCLVLLAGFIALLVFHSFWR